MSSKTSHRRTAVRQTRRQMLAELACRPEPTERTAVVLADIQTRIDKAAQR